MSHSMDGTNLSDEDLKALYEKLKKYEIPEIDSKLFQTDQDCSHISSEIISRIRRIHYILTANTTPLNLKSSPTKLDYSSSASIAPVPILDVFHPLIVQSVTTYISYLINNPKALASMVSSFSTHQYFQHFVSIVIPSIFSFFAFKESALLAFQFYTLVSETLTPESLTVIVAPFFSSPSVVRFSSVVFSKLFWSQFMSKFPLEEFIQALVNIAAHHIRSLPEYHVALLRFLSTKWTMEEIWRLIIKDLLIPQLKLMAPLSPYVHSDETRFDIPSSIAMMEAVSLGKHGRINLPSLRFASSNLEYPGTFITFNQTLTLDLVFTLFDLRVLLAFQTELPRHSQHLLEVLNQPQSQNFVPFSLPIFPKIHIPPSNFIQRNLFFDVKPISPPNDCAYSQTWSSLIEAVEPLSISPLEALSQGELRTCNPILDEKLRRVDLGGLKKFGLQTTVASLSQEAFLLEILLSHKLEYKKLNQWLFFTGEYDEAVSFNVAMITMSQLSKASAKTVYGRFWEIIAEQPEFPAVRFWLSILMLDKVKSVVMAPIESAYHNMESRYRTLVSGKKKAEIIEAGGRTLNLQLSEATTMLGLVTEKSPFISRAFVFFSFLEQIQKVAKALGFEDSREQIDGLIHAPLSNVSCIWIFKTALILQGVLFCDERFAQWCKPDLEDIWKKFTVAFFQFLSEDVDLMTEFAKYSTGGVLNIQ